MRSSNTLNRRQRSGKSVLQAKVRHPALRAAVEAAEPRWMLSGTTFNYDGHVDMYTVPVTGLYQITVDGAQGGAGARGTGGLGAEVRGSVMLTAGTVLDIVVGQLGTSGAPVSDPGAGGGGSFVYTTAKPLAVAGGGGGGGFNVGNGGPGQSTTSGQDGLSSPAGAGGMGGAGGGGGGADGGGGGAGYDSKGSNGTNFHGTGGAGGSAPPSFAGGAGDTNTNGGFGGGGGAGYIGSGGGGGYSGGGGDGGSIGLGGGGGGSYLDPSFSSTALSSGVHSGNGSVTIFNPLLVNTIQDPASPIAGLNSLREAIAYADTLSTPSTIVFDPAVFPAGSLTTITLGGTQLDVNNTASAKITINGGGVVAVSGNNASEVFDIASGNVEIDGLTIRDGKGDSTGTAGGIENVGTLTLNNSTVTNNTTLGYGSGIRNDGTMTINQCTISNNFNASGILNSATLYMNSSTVSGNTSVTGVPGGGIETYGSMALTNCTITGNSAPACGGVDIVDGSATIRDCTVSGNQATGGDGGGILLEGGQSVILDNTIVAGNSASRGAEVAERVSPETIQISDNLFGSSSETTASAFLGFTPGNTNIVATSDGTTPTALGSILNTTPANNGGPTQTLALVTGSPAIGAGATFDYPGTTTPITTDQRGLPRHTTPDIGAYEHQNQSLVVTTTVDEDNSTSDPAFGTGTSLREAINFAETLTGPQTITFASSLTSGGPGTITLNGTELDIADSGALTIAGPGANLLTINANNASRVFDVSGGGNVSINGLTITGGNANVGGGIYNSVTTLKLNADAIAGNISTSFGGGLASPSGGTVTITNSTFSNNIAGNEGAAIEQQGIASSPASMTLTNCTISGNTANGTGYGAISNVASGGTATLTVHDCTIARNTGSAAYGAGILNSSNSGSATATYQDTIFANNQANIINAGGATSTSLGHNLSSDGTGTLTAAGDLPNSNPMLGSLASNGGPTQTMALLPGSPAISAGVTISGITTDQRGVARHATPDIGAFELATVTPLIATTQQPASSTVGSTIADQATVSHGRGLTGTVTFKLYSNSTATGPALFTDTEAMVPATTSSTIAPGTTGASETGNTVTITTTSAHGLNVGDSVTIAGVGVAGYNGTFTITSATTTSFTYTNASSGLASSGGGTVTHILPGVYTATSAGYIAAAAGTDYWVDTYNGDANNSAVTSGLAAEPVTITKATPTITTTQQPASATVGATIADQATVSGFNPTGTVTFDLYSNATATGTPLFTDTETLSAGTAASKGFTTTAAGTDYWVVSYNGDTNNTAVTSSDTSEPVSVGVATPTISTNASPTITDIFGSGSLTDSATVTGGNNPTGTITFEFFNNSTATGTPLFTDTETLSAGKATSKSTGAPAVGTYYWVDSYGGDANNAPVTSGDAAEPVVVTKTAPLIFTNAQPTSAIVGATIADQATIAGYSATGTVTFNLYNNASGTGTPLFTDTETLSSGKATSKGYTTTATGTDYWVDTYSGDTNNTTVTSGLSAEPVVINPLATPTIATTAQPTSAIVGATIADTATVSGSSGVPTGAVIFRLYNNASGTGTPLVVDSESLVGGVATSMGYSTLSTGTDYWVDTYYGDSTYAGVTSGLAAEPVVINPLATPTIATTAQPTSAIIGAMIADTATVSGSSGVPTGAVIFRLFNNATGSGTPLFISSELLVGGVASSGGFSTLSTGTDYWVDTYYGDSTYAGIASGLTAEPVVINNLATPTIATTAQPTSAIVGATIADTATVSGSNGVPTGTVIFRLYNNPTGSGTPLFISSQSLVGGVASSGGYSTLSTGTDYWVDTYNGDSTYAGVASGLTAEPVVINNLATPTIATTAQPTSAIVGATIADTATVSGSSGVPTGAVIFRLYNNPTGSGTPLVVDSESLVGGVATSMGYSTLSTGTDYWVDTYYGDSTYTGVASGVAAEPVTITPATSKPVITLDPINMTLPAGVNVTFTAAASGTPNPSVQWQVSTDGGASFAPMPGATSASLVFVASSSQTGYEYRAVFTNSAGSATTTAATLTVNSAPLVTVNPTSLAVAPGGTASFTVAASGNPVPTVQWYTSPDGIASFQPIGGATSPTLTLTGVTAAMNGYQYKAVFTNPLGIATTSAATLTVTATQVAPMVTLNPSNQTVASGQVATFTAAATGAPTPAVQWQVSTNGGASFANIPGATSTTYTVLAAIALNGADYRAVFTNTKGSATTTAATLTVTSSVTGVTIFGNTAPPSYYQNVNDPTIAASGVEVGMKFQSDIAGSVTAIRFFKGNLDTGTHTGELWTVGGTLLATATFTGETASGWQTVTLSNPVVITANTVYIVSYHTNATYIAYTPYGLASAGVDNPPLHVLANGVAGNNGVYEYGPSAFPTVYNGQAPNYWVDVVFSSAAPLTIFGGTTPPSFFQNVSDPLITANNGVEVGMKFQSSLAGQITGVRFFKGSLETGTQTAELWDSAGNLLATAVFTNETPSGWQSVNFSAPVSIAANTLYVISYHTTSQYIAYTPNGLASSITNGPLSLLGNGVSGNNGLYKYGSTSQFPSVYNGQAPNYWVDVNFISG